jgi:hypothetical protein
VRTVIAALRLAAYSAGLVLTWVSPAAAEWHLTPLIGVTFGGNTSIFDPEHAAHKARWNFGGAVRLIGPGLLGAEAIFVYVPGFFDRPGISFVANNNSFAMMGNAVLATPSRNKYGLRLSLSGGIGLLHAARTDLRNEPLLPLPAVRENLLGYNVGGGATGFFSDRTGVRFDLRHYGTLMPTEAPAGVAFGSVRLRYWTGSVGVVFRY